MAEVTVNLIWLRGPLTELARMSLASYLQQGCKVALWTYQVDLPVTTGGLIQLRDANELIREGQLNRYAFQPSGQMALACDLLAWRINYVYGGWMGHLDVLLRKPLHALDKLPYVFGPHHRYTPSAALWKAPAASLLLHRVLERVPSLPLTDWHVMMRVFSKQVHLMGLQMNVVESLINDDSDEAPIRALTQAGNDLLEPWKRLTAIHWMGSGTIRGCVPAPGSFYDRWREETIA